MKSIYIKPLKIGEICTINDHVYQARKGHCDTCALRGKDECHKGQIDCMSILDCGIHFKLIK